MTPRDSLLVAQLSQATIAVLGALNRERRENPHSAEVINRILKSAQYNLRNSLINQGTLIGHAYLTMVWLWEKQRQNFGENFPDRPLDNPVAPWPHLDQTVLQWENGLVRTSHRTLQPWLRHVRNSLSHGRVWFDPIDNESLVFADALSGAQEPHTLIRMHPQLLASVSDLVVQACENNVA
jgi:hypothetical protein